MPIFHAIAAMSENRVIGNQGKIPWHLPEDFRWFKHKTMGGTLIMGRKTFESIGKPLPGRKTLVLSRHAFACADVTVLTLETFTDEYLPHHRGENYWVCGGAQIYEQMLNHCGYLYLTVVKPEADGDAYFPSLRRVAEYHRLDQMIHANDQFRIERWKHLSLSKEAELPPELWPFAEVQG
jgi:dihydrofolate reductase